MNQKITLIIPEHAPRDIVAIEREMGAVRKARTKLIADSAGRDVTTAELREWVRLRRQDEALRREFCSELHRLTGMTCSRVINAVEGVA